MSLITDESIKDAINYFSDKVSNSSILKYLIKTQVLSIYDMNPDYDPFDIKYSKENKAYYNDFIYIDPNKIYIYPETANRLLYNDFHEVNNIRFYIYEENDSIIIEGGINLHLEMSKPPQIKINDDIKFEYPKEELRSFRIHHQYLNWHQDMTTSVKNLKEVIDILVLTMEKLHEL